jgi:hypothetical protein
LFFFFFSCFPLEDEGCAAVRDRSMKLATSQKSDEKMGESYEDQEKKKNDNNNPHARAKVCCANLQVFA